MWLKKCSMKFFRGTLLHFQKPGSCCSSSLQVDGRAECLGTVQAVQSSINVPKMSPSTSKYFCTAIRCNWIISTVCCCWTTWPNMIPTTYQNVLRCLAFQRPTVNIVPKRQTETFASHLLCDRYHKNHNSFHQFSNCLEPSCAKSHSSTSSSPSLIVAGDARV